MWRTVRHLKPEQLYGRVRFRLARPRVDLSSSPPLCPVTGPWERPARREPSMIGPTWFRLLGEEADLADHGWDDPALAKLWRYNLHYFDDLNAIGAEARLTWHTELIERWISENPPTTGSGWEPYPTSLRISNWIKFALGGHYLSDAARYSLALQTRWLSKRLEWHLLGNHLFANAKALVFAGLFFDGAEADEWFATGAQILRQQLPEQILSDGSQFELSPMYHALALDDILDLINCARAYGEDSLSRELALCIPRMLDWLFMMTHPDGKIAFFNDTAFGIAPDNSELRDYAKRLGFAAKPPVSPLIHSRPSGYIRMAMADAVVIADVASVGPDYLPGHAHADTLSFEFSLLGHRLVVNGGTSIYGIGEERLRQRGTAAHSTLVVDGEDTSEVWSGFRVGRRAKPVNVEAWEGDQYITAKGEHDGYKHLPGRPVHRREWTLSEEGLRVDDTVQGAGKHSLEVYFHLHPDLAAEVDEDNAVVWITRSDSDQFIAKFTVLGGTVEVIRSSWHPEFGVSIPARTIRVSAKCSLPHSLHYEFEWGPA